LRSCRERRVKVLFTYYYDCLPYQSLVPSDEEREMVSRKQRFLSALKRLDRFTVREGRLEYRGTADDGSPIFQQKRVDLQIGLDIATVVTRGRADIVAMVSGDSDLLPAVQMAKDSGVIVRLIHGPKVTYHGDLWEAADERKQISSETIALCSRGS
jgi:uncharacterized LabA/DUF88 family protein